MGNEDNDYYYNKRFSQTALYEFGKRIISEPSPFDLLEYLNSPVPEKYILKKSGILKKMSDNDRMRLNQIKDLKEHFDS